MTYLFFKEDSSHFIYFATIVSAFDSAKYRSNYLNLDKRMLLPENKCLKHEIKYKA